MNNPKADALYILLEGFFSELKTKSPEHYKK